MFKRFLSFALLLCILTSGAQKIKTVSGEYTYIFPESISLEEAKRIALDQAKIDALAREFGTIVSQSNSSVVSNSMDDVAFHSLGSSDVKGEWIETIGEPKYETIFDPLSQLTSVKCEIKGKAREIVSARVEFEAIPLRNGKDKRFESSSFKDGDDLFLYFLSPIDGYLSVFLLDETTQTVYSILPYKHSKQAAFPIVRNKEYILFSIDCGDKEIRNEIDEYTLTCEYSKEFNTLYFLFSPEKFYKGVGYSSGDIELPENLPFVEFQTRLGKLLATNSNIQFLQKSISISK